MPEAALTGREISELARLFDSPERARNLLEEAGFPPGRMPGMQGNTAEEFWREINRMVAAGITRDGRRNILEAAAGHFPANPVFQIGPGTPDTPYPGTAGRTDSTDMYPETTRLPDQPHGPQPVPSPPGDSPHPEDARPKPPRIPLMIAIVVFAVLAGTAAVGLLVATDGEDNPSPPHTPVSLPSTPPNLSSISPPPSPATNPSAATAPTSTDDCLPPPLPGRPLVRPLVEPGDVPGISIGSVAYYLDVLDNGNMQIALAARTDGALPPGHHLIIVQRADPNSMDRSGRPGYDVDFYKYSLASGCRQFNADQLGYDGAAGITYKMRVMLVDQATFDYIKEQRSSPNYAGFDKSALTRRGAQVVARFDIPGVE